MNEKVKRTGIKSDLVEEPASGKGGEKDKKNESGNEEMIKYKLKEE